VITLRDVSFTYQGAERPSLDGVSLSVGAGELVVLAGESGCGKTTITRCLNGLIPHFYPGTLIGQMALDDVDVTGIPMHEIGRSVASVFQDPRSQFFTTRTTAEVAFACENFGIEAGELRARVDSAFADLGIRDLIDRSVFELSSGEKQKIAIAATYALRPKVAVLDEPSANLDVRSTHELADVLARLKAWGVTIVVAEHRLFYLADLVDRLIYFRDGRVVESFTRDELKRLDWAALDARGLRQVELTKVRIAGRPRRLHESTLLQVREAQFAYRPGEPILQTFTMHGRRGEVVGIVGDNGSGKSTAAKVAVGLLEAQSGRVRLDYAVTRAKRRLRRSFFVMQEADYQLYAESVLAELLLGKSGGDTAREAAFQILADLGLETMCERHPQTLSGGQKQRLTIAVGLASGADVIFLDEPTSGLDARSMARVADALRLLADRGRFVCVVTHDFELLVAACERVVRIEDGCVVAEVAVEPGAELDILEGLLAARPIAQNVHAGAN
jgi:energy-coupling factor transporter ATP-binding protein EcfA2